MPAHLSQLDSFGEVVRWLIEELGAFCPAAQRLRAYAARPDDPSLRDVRYHVQEAGCRLCRDELEALGHPQR
jgi:hypothetical protein